MGDREFVLAAAGIIHAKYTKLGFRNILFCEAFEEQRFITRWPVFDLPLPRLDKVAVLILTDVTRREDETEEANNEDLAQTHSTLLRLIVECPTRASPLKLA